MDNQHRKISGYHELTQAEIDLMNEVKALGPQIESVIDKLQRHVNAQHVAAMNAMQNDGKTGDQDHLDNASPRRWVAIGQTNLQQGLMALTRAVAQPEFF